MDDYDPLVIESAWLFTREIHKRCVPTKAQSSSDHRISKGIQAADSFANCSWEYSLRKISRL